MCGRYYLDESVIREIRQFLGNLDTKGKEWKARDVYPSEQAVVLTSRNEEISAELMAWGFPSYQGKGLMINARAETANERPMFRESVQNRRCVVPAKHFYEWDREKNKVTFKSREGDALYMAGMFDHFQGEDRFVIITTEANESMRKVHDRMPLLLEESEVAGWLRNDKSTEEFLRKKPEELEREQEFEQVKLSFL
ncbi:SOS response-associated peptidase [Blautia schinkii]|nr:SOS response-associated peptidase [Blautia schinkii]